MAFGDFTVDRNSTKYVLGSGGDIISYATDEPAFEFNTDGSYKGLLVEPAATNLCLQSEDITTTWSPINATLTANATTAPDGNTTADKLNDDSGTGIGVVYVQQSVTVSAATKYTASVFLKADQLAFAHLKANNYDGTTDGYQFFGLSGDGTLGTAVGLDDSTITKYPDGWYRCSITWTQGAADTQFGFFIYVADSISNANIDRDGTSSIFVWGAQVEEGPIATSYIPTTTASVTRVKDDITQTGAQSLIGQTEGTLYVEADTKNATGKDQVLLHVTDGTNDNGLHITKIEANDYVLVYYRVGGLSISSIFVFTSVLTSGVKKFAVTYNQTSMRVFLNGSAGTEDTGLDASAMTTLTQIDLGQTYSTAAQANMHIRALALFTRKLTDAEAQALTTL